MRTPVAATPSGVIALTVPAVPTGMNTGVSTGPCAVTSRPRRAAPSRADTSNPMLTSYLGYNYRLFPIFHPAAAAVNQQLNSPLRVVTPHSHRSQLGQPATGWSG